MKNKWIYLLLSASAVLVLSACNATGDTDSNTDPKTNEQNETPANTPNDAANENDVEEQDNTPLFREDEASLTYTLNDEQKEVTGYLTESDEQNYSVYVADGFALTGEEPNRDALYFEENDAVFMRIETISTDEADYEIILNNMMQTLSAVSFEGQPERIREENRLPNGEKITNAVGYEVKKELGTISGYVFERNGLIIRLTIFDRNTANLTDAFLKMGQTVDIK